jgi:hypothetical protein
VIQHPARPPAKPRLVELSHAIEHGMTTYPGLPGPELTEHLTREAAEAVFGPGVRFQIGRTMDTAAHRLHAGFPRVQAALDAMLQALADHVRRRP